MRPSLQPSSTEHSHQYNVKNRGRRDPVTSYLICEINSSPLQAGNLIFPLPFLWRLDLLRKIFQRQVELESERCNYVSVKTEFFFNVNKHAVS